MSIVQNVACPACQENGHDHRGNHLMVFEDGGQYCNRAHHHSSGEPLYIPPDGESPILKMEINGTIKYSPAQFKDLDADGKLANPVTRAIALSGMRIADQLEVATEDEKAQLYKERQADYAYYEKLKTKNLVSRHIRGEIAKHFGIRVGLSTEGKVARHYYPCYEKSTGQWSGAKCRTLPKDFKSGHLGWTHGDLLLFGQNTTQLCVDSGERFHTLTLTGGECDAAAVFQMLVDQRKGTRFEGQLPHVWSPNKGEKAIEEIILNKEAIDRFKKIIIAGDDDETGRKFVMDVARLFRGKVFRVPYPSGMKDPNECLMHGHEKEFIDGWFNPVSPFEGGKLREMSHYREKAKQAVTMGLSWPWPEMDEMTYGIGFNRMIVWGAGTGVGKTQSSKEVVDHLVHVHNEPVEVIYLEERPEVTVRSYAGLYCNKDLLAPPIHDKGNPFYSPIRDYTEEEANEAIDKLCDEGMITIADLEGRKNVNDVMDVIEEGIARGIRYFVIDNLTAFEHEGKDGKQVSKVEAIDETMRRLGTLKDEHAIHLHVVSHLKRVSVQSTDEDGNKITKSHAEGAEVRDDHFRGAGSITFWADVVMGIERDTQADGEEKLVTTFRSVKNRTVGRMVGSTTKVKMSEVTGRLEPFAGYKPRKDFDYGTQETEEEF